MVCGMGLAKQLTLPDLVLDEGLERPKAATYKKRWRGSLLDFVNLITTMPSTMPSRHSGDQVYKVDFLPHCPKRGGKVKGAYLASRGT